jgi:hypothetical protein
MYFRFTKAPNLFDLFNLKYLHTSYHKLKNKSTSVIFSRPYLIIFFIPLPLLFAACDRSENPNPKTNPGSPGYLLHFKENIEIENIVAIRGYNNQILSVSGIPDNQANVFKLSQEGILLREWSLGSNKLGKLRTGNHYTISSSHICLCDAGGRLYIASLWGESEYMINTSNYSLAYAINDYALAYSSTLQRLDLYKLTTDATLIESFPFHKTSLAISYYDHFFLVSFAEGYAVIDIDGEDLHIAYKGDDRFKNIKCFVVNNNRLNIESASTNDTEYKIARVAIDEYGDFHYISRNDNAGGNLLAYSSDQNLHYIYRKHNDIRIFEDSGGLIESIHSLPVSNYPQWQVADSCGVYFYDEYVLASHYTREGMLFFHLGKN